MVQDSTHPTFGYVGCRFLSLGASGEAQGSALPYQRLDELLAVPPTIGVTPYVGAPCRLGSCSDQPLRAIWGEYY